MDYQKCGNQIVVRLDRGEEIMATLGSLIEKEGISLANVNGLGAVDHAVIGTFAVAEQAYHKRTVTGDMEILSLNGTISEMDGKGYLHLHVVLCGMDGMAMGGHLNEAVISGTGELILTCLEGRVDRAFDSRVGLNTLVLRN